MMFVLVCVFWIALGLLVYAQVGYPLLMLPFARKRQAPAMENDAMPGVTLVIPAYNEEAVLRAKLENSLRIDYPSAKLEIIVASDGSSDQTIPIANEFVSRGVRVLAFQERRGKASIVTDAVAASSHPLVCLCDANVMFLPDALRRMVEHFAAPKVGAVSGDVRLASEESDFGSGESAYYGVERLVQLGECAVGSMMGVDGGMFVVRRELFRPLAPDTILDDFVTSMNVIQQGYKIVYESDAVAHENGTPSWRHEYRRRIRVNTGAMQCLKRGQYPRLTQPVELWQFLSHKFLRWIGPVLLLAVLVLNAALVTQGTIYQMGLAGQGLFYGAAALAAWSPKFRETKLGGVTFYFTLSHIAMLVGMYRGLVLKQKGTWDRTSRSPLKTDAGLSGATTIAEGPR